MSLLFLLPWMWTAEPAVVDVWPGYRGDGTSRTAAQDVPLRWSPRENIAWKASLPGYGQSSPVVWRDRVFVTATEGRDKEKCLVLAVAASSGKIVWQRQFAASQRGKNNPSMSRAAPTPVVDADGIYAFFESGELLALSHDGRTRWQRSLVQEYGAFKNHHDLGSSPAQTDQALILQIDHHGPSYLLAVEKATGKTLWKTERPSRLSWTTPVVTVHDGRTLVLVSSNGDLTCYDAANGKKFWSLDGLAGNLIPSATVGEGLVVVGAGESGLTTDQPAAARSNCCLRLTSKDGQPGYELLWRGKKAVAHHASPVIHRGQVYLVTKPGVVYCLDAQTGAERYAERLDNPCWATPIAAGDYLYFFGKDGVTTVIEAGPKFRKVAANRLWTEEDLQARRAAARQRPENQFPPLPEQGRKEMEAMLADAVGEVVYGAAAVDGACFMRTGTDLFCVRKQP